MLKADLTEDAAYLAEHIMSRGKGNRPSTAGKFHGEKGKMAIAYHKATVRRYFEEALDKRNLVVDEIVYHRMH